MLPFFRLLRSTVPGLRLFAGLLVTLVVAAAQSVRWEPASGTIARDQVATLSLVFRDCDPKTDPVLPAVPGLQFDARPSRSEQSSLNISGTQAIRQRTVTFTYRARPTISDGEIRIPAFTVETDQGAITVAPAGFRLADATVGQSGLPLDRIATTRFKLPERSVWAGEVFPLSLVLDVDRSYATNNILGGPPEWAPSPLVAEEWGKPVGTESRSGGRARFLVNFDTRVAAPANFSGTLTVPVASQEINLPTRDAFPFSIVNQSMFDAFTVHSAPATLEIRALPAPAPADFHGAVGQFTLESKIVPEQAAVGEPVTWTLTLSGTGNWPAIDKLPPRAVSRDFRVVAPRAQKTPVGETLFEATFGEDLVLIPQKPGSVTLGPYTLSVFNPETGAYETLRTEPVTLHISPAANVTPGITAPGANEGADATVAAGGGVTQRVPGPVAKLPSAPLAPGLLGQAPLSAWPGLLLKCLWALALPAMLWLGLAVRHAARHDTLRTRRAAHARLRAILTRLETSPTASADDLRAWQQATRELFAMESLTPAARDFADPVWAALWVQTERALYRPSTTLASEWHAQAREAHARATPPKRSLFAPLRRAHLLPAALVLGLAVVAIPNNSHAATPEADYAAGEFAKAEQAWRKTLEAAPLDAAARHNLALALAQQGRWDEAAAHAHAVVFQAPGESAAHRLLDVTGPKAAYRLAMPPTAVVALSPRGWQTLGLAAVIALLALAPTAWVCSRYAAKPRARRSLRALSQIVFLLGLLGIAAATLALRSYGPVAHPDAVLVWRDSKLRAVPTDAGEQKVISDLPAGTIARVDKQFLGWRRVVLRDGNTGWVRAEPLVGLWRTP